MNFDTIAENTAKEIENKTYCSDGRDNVLGILTPKDKDT
jgi:hypothetical protein